MKKALATFFVLSAACFALQADTITLWDFNSVPPDGNPATGTLSPYSGAGTCSVIGEPTYTFAVPAQATRDTDSPTDNSGLRTVTYPAAAANNKKAGIQYLASTVGFTNVHLQWDQNNSNTSSKYWRMQYTTDGTTWIDKDVITAPGNNLWVDGHTDDFSTIPATANNPNFGFRLVSEFQSTATGSGTAGYVGNASTYNPGGTCWMDYVVLTGTVFVPANLTRTNLTTQVSGNQLTLSWPADHTGWQLQAQTNAPGVGLTINWVDVAGSSATNQMSFTISPTNGSVFYRMVYP